MAIYTHNEVANSPGTFWAGLDAFIASISSTQVVLVNTDGTRTRLTGTGFTGTVGSTPAAPGTLTAGSITAMSRTNVAGSVVFETIAGFVYTAVAFSSRLNQAGDTDLQRIASDVLAGGDTFNGFSGFDFFKGFAGNDTFNGGDGFDTVAYNGPTMSGPIVATLGPTATVEPGRRRLRHRHRHARQHRARVRHGPSRYLHGRGRLRVRLRQFRRDRGPRRQRHDHRQRQYAHRIFDCAGRGHGQSQCGHCRLHGRGRFGRHRRRHIHRRQLPARLRFCRHPDGSRRPRRVLLHHQLRQRHDHRRLRGHQ